MPETLNIAELFPDRVATACRRIGQTALGLYPQEQELVQKAVDKRRREFAAGRACAREALGAIGCAPLPILRHESLAPVWPDGILGTIAHSHTWAGAAVSRVEHLAGIGLDIETVSRVSLNIARKVLTVGEAAVFKDYSAAEQQAFLALVFSAKEAVYKCLTPLVAARLGFHDAEVRQVNASCFEVRMCPAVSDGLPACACMTGGYLLYEGCIFTGIALEA